MLWYGSLFYFLFFCFSILFVFVFLKIFFSNILNKFTFNYFYTHLILSFFLFVYFIVLIFSYLIYENFKSFSFYDLNHITFFDNFQILSLHNFFFLNYNLLNLYYFPFIYIFLIVTVLSVLFCMSYSYSETLSFILYVFFILFFGYSLFFTNSFTLFFFFYEMLLIPSFFILYKYAKTRRCVEAAYLMFFWTQFGALFLIFSFLYLFFITGISTFYAISCNSFSQFEINFLFVCWLIGFGVKLPIWPFYGWLPKAHVEASTNFSIFLSGVLVKFAFFGLLKCLFTLQLEPTFYHVYPFLTIGIVDAAFKLFYQIDLKKLVAYSTVVEMHWLTICVLSGNSPLSLASFCMLISHALLSTNSFLLVDAINRRFKTRLITEISGLNFLCPKLFLIILANSLIFLGFPGSIFFIAEFLFFSFSFDLFPILAIFLLIILYLFAPTFFFRSWMNSMFGFSQFLLNKHFVDLTKKEFLIFSFFIFLMFWLGLTWQSFIF